MKTITGGQMVVRTLRDLGADMLFSVSGNQILPIYDAITESGLRLIHMRHESAAAYAAAASAEIRNRPGIVLVSAGPAFVCALAGIAAARSLELPLLFLSGATSIADAGRGGFQDFDQRTVAGSVCKATLEVTAVEQINPVISQAWQLAQSGIPGPVHVSLPVDTLLARTSDQPGFKARLPADPALVSSQEAILNAMAQRLAQAQRPLLIVRPCAARGNTGEALSRLARLLGIEPIITECPRGLRDLKYSHLIPSYAASDCALVIAPADFAVGFLAREVIASQGDLLLIDAPGDPLPHRMPDLHCQVPPQDALAYLANMMPRPTRVEADWTQIWTYPPLEEAFNYAPSADGLHPLEVAAQLRHVLAPNDVIVLDGGEFCQWVRMGLRDLPNRIVWNSKFGGIGSSLPLAIGMAATGHAGRTFVLMGDGAAGYHLSEFETAARYGIPLVAIIGNDARWAAEWFLQASRYGSNRVFETTLLPARYEQAAMGFGAMGANITDARELQDALATSLSVSLPACLNVKICSVRSPAIQA